ncbi:MAG TPA: hypothetical protein VE907_18635 [Gammaproteobacteria bacterium]|nr:hypothetical protein [Gammaproteobacteria bacterium]
MKYWAVAAVVALASFLMPAPSWSKGPISKITVQPLGIGRTVEISDKETLGNFAIWSGPGVGGWDMVTTIPRPGEAAFIIDWTRGQLRDGPNALTRYQVVMQVEEYAPPCNKYEVIYGVSEAGEGYVYLPNWDETPGRCNSSLIYRGVEGNWFHSSPKWDQIVMPLLRTDR